MLELHFKIPMWNSIYFVDAEIGWTVSYHMHLLMDGIAHF